DLRARPRRRGEPPDDGRRLVARRRERTGRGGGEAEAGRAAAGGEDGKGEEDAMTDAAFLAAFEDGSLPEERFHHRDHIRWAWLRRCAEPLAAALARFTAGLRRFAARHGKAGLYHETITWAYFFLIHERMQRGAEASWEEFAAANPDLFTWRPSILAAYYR